MPETKTLELNLFEVEYYREGDESGYRKVSVTFTIPTPTNSVDDAIVAGFWRWFDTTRYKQDTGEALPPAKGGENGKYFLAFCGQGGRYGSIGGKWHKEGFGDYYFFKAKSAKQAKAYLRNLGIYPDFLQEAWGNPIKVAATATPATAPPPTTPERPMVVAHQGRLFLK